MLETALQGLCSILNLKAALSPQQARFIANELTCDTILRSLTLADVRLVMRRAARGEYGELYENINPPKVLGWMRAYVAERGEELAANNQRENDMRKHDAQPLSDDALAALYDNARHTGGNGDARDRRCAHDTHAADEDMRALALRLEREVLALRQRNKQLLSMLRAARQPPRRDGKQSD